MIKKYALLFFLVNTIIAQGVSMSDLNRISNQQLDEIKNQLQNIDTEPSIVNNSLLEEESKPVEIPSNNFKSESQEYFGYDYFKNDISFFDNIPTPPDYKLGPGDEVIVSLWGETNYRNNMVINKDGMIFFDNIGFINLSNQTLQSAESILKEELSKIYSTLKDKNNPSRLMLSLGKLKSMNIYFSGHIENPGISLVHPFSDIFSAIVQAGGVNDNGSLREVQLIRNDKIINTVDFYSFFMNGKNSFSNIKLIDGDTIHIPSFKNRISISGEINRPSTYELLPNESILDIVGYASGFTSTASSTLMLSQIIPIEKRSSDDNARASILLDIKDNAPIVLNNGDSINVKPISNVDSNVVIYGRVKSPGEYPGTNTTLKDILDIAGGFDDPLFRLTIRENEITILRQDVNKFYSIEIITSYKESDKLQLIPNDKIFVYENINYRNNYTFRVEGEVNKPGTYAFTKGMTVRNALDLAQGLTELSTIDNIILYQEFSEIIDSGEVVVTTSEVSDTDLDFVIGSNTIIKALPFENVVRVEGNVYNPGLVAHSRGLTMSKAIEQAGGLKPYSLRKRSYVKRANGEIDKANLFRGSAKRLFPGDTVVVPVDENPSDFEITSFIADLSVTIANIAAILLIVDNQSD